MDTKMVHVYITLTDGTVIIDRQHTVDDAMSFIASSVELYGEELIKDMAIVRIYENGSLTMHYYRGGSGGGVQLAALPA